MLWRPGTKDFAHSCFGAACKSNQFFCHRINESVKDDFILHQTSHEKFKTPVSGDLEMGNNLDSSRFCLVKIGFLNDHVDQNRQMYMDKYDIVIEDPEDMKFIFQLFCVICSAELRFVEESLQSQRCNSVVDSYRPLPTRVISCPPGDDHISSKGIGMKTVIKAIYGGQKVKRTEIRGLHSEWTTFLKALETVLLEVPLWKHYRPKNFEVNMKNLIKMSEDCGVFDEASFLYEVLAELLLHPTESPDEGHSFFFPFADYDHFVITRETSVRQLKHGTTGHFTWPAAVAFVEFVILERSKDPLALNGKCVLEVGCGVGFLGICLLTVLQLKAYTFTDYKQELLDCTEHNVNINFSQHESLSKKSNQLKPPHKIHLLDFCEDHPSFVSECDVLIGCEVVFDPAIVPGLSSFIKRFLTEDTSKICHIVCTIRNEETFTCFTDELERLKLKFSLVDISSTESVIKICTIVAG